MCWFYTVDENIIGAPNTQNDFGAMKLQLNVSLLRPKKLLILIFLSIIVARPSIAIAGIDNLPLLFATAFNTGNF